MQIYPHLTRTANDILHILKGKGDVLSPKSRKSVQSALIKIAQLLHRDKTPSITSLPPDVSIPEKDFRVNTQPVDDTILTSEDGVIPHIYSRFKTTLDPVIPDSMVTHQGLYANTSHPTVQKLVPQKKTCS